MVGMFECLNLTNRGADEEVLVGVETAAVRLGDQQALDLPPPTDTQQRHSAHTRTVVVYEGSMPLVGPMCAYAIIQYAYE